MRRSVVAVGWRRWTGTVVLAGAATIGGGSSARADLAPLVHVRAAHHAAHDAAVYTVAVPTAELVQLMRAQVFTDSGRFYPCRANPSCAAWGHDIALSQPEVSVDGPRVVFSVHLLGSYAINQFFTPTVAGDLIISGVPVVRNNKVVLSEAEASAGPSSDVTFRAFLEATHGRIESMLEQSSGFDLAGYLAYSASDPDAPPPRLPNVRCVDPQQIQVQSVATQPQISTINAVVNVAAACGARS